MVEKNRASVAEGLFKDFVIGLFGRVFEASLLMPLAPFTGVIVLGMLLDSRLSRSASPHH
jgi:hypothetical protein